ncbi:MAG: SAM-dependent chlorinase/fluorinase, partial [Chloroflexi bacterium]|nr:SAM-dependent chlorinase/fluorinase [Chloroflexota bacterium]
ADAYVANMKGVILEILPAARIVDVSHEVAAQYVAGAAYLLQTAYRYFPGNTIHVAVVDPGVGTARKPIAVAARHGIFVGPDNGIFGRALADQDALDPATGELLRGAAVSLSNERYWRLPVSQTFHGRDIFAPAAAHLGRGVPLSELGRQETVLARLAGQEPIRTGDDIHGVILHVDRFGNAISNVPGSMVTKSVNVDLGGRIVAGLATSYQDAPLAAIVGSAGLVEIAARNGDAARRLGLRVGDPVVVRPAP